MQTRLKVIGGGVMNQVEFGTRFSRVLLKSLQSSRNNVCK